MFRRKIILVMQVTKHTLATCPINDDKYSEVTVKWMENIEDIAAKFGVKFMRSGPTTQLTWCTCSMIRPVWAT
jgi:hypothetical protein